MRLFLAIDLPKETKRELAEQLKDLRLEYPYFRWVNEELYHITLQFFGDARHPENLVKKIGDVLYDVFPFHLYSLEADLSLRNQIVMYLQFQRNKMLEHLIEELREKLQIHTAKKFIPHLTIARYRIPSKQQYLLIKKKIRNLKVDIEFPVTQITLFDSVIENNRPMYKTVAELPLAT